MPAVTVIIPAFNAESFIGDSLASIRGQTLRDIEVLVIDDGSSDDTIGAVHRSADSLDVTVVSQTNAGPAAARNKGIVRARGRYCAFLDADDVMLPDRLALQAALLDASPALGLVHSDLMTFDERGIIHQTRRAFSNPCGGDVLDSLLLDNFITTSTVMAPREHLLQAGMFPEGRRLSEDFELWLRMAAKWEVGYIDRPLIRYRQRPGSLSHDKLATARSALDVVNGFWQDNAEHRRRFPGTYRRSLAHHYRVAGVAAIAANRRLPALRYLLRALSYKPLMPTAWKSLLKSILPASLTRMVVTADAKENA